MLYRMKRNGAGLASICILSTMVLVMISSSGCLYIGKENILRRQYPRDMQLAVWDGEEEHLDLLQSISEESEQKSQETAPLSEKLPDHPPRMQA